MQHTEKDWKLLEKSICLYNQTIWVYIFEMGEIGH